MTESEIDTIRFFDEIGCDLIRIPESSEKTPDFFIETEKQKIFIEVKEITDNDEDKKLIEEVATHGQVGAHDGPEVGKRFRPAIQSANKQLKKKCKEGEPGLVIIQDVRDFFTKSVMPQEEIKQAMFGDRVTWISVNTKEIESDIFQENKTTTNAKNTTISAVGLMMKNSHNNKLTLHIHHNPHARNKLKSPVFTCEGVYEYHIDNTSSYSNFQSGHNHITNKGSG